MAEIGAVYDATPVPRTPADIIASDQDTERDPIPGPVATNKWLTASIVNDAGTVIEQALNEAQRRDPKHRRTWVALVDGNNHQIQRIKAGAKARKVKVTIVVDFVHVLEYLWNAAWCFHAARDPAAEQWVHRQATAVLNGHARRVAGQIRRKTTTAQLGPINRKIAEEAATYLTRKAAHLDYPTALTQGWPIATGIIEGACRHIVKDRMDITGARWRLTGAEAVLKLRAIKANGDFDAYWRTSTKNDTTSTKPATTTTSSPKRHDRSLQKSHTPLARPAGSSSRGPQHRLNLRALPHEHGSLRPATLIERNPTSRAGRRLPALEAAARLCSRRGRPSSSQWGTATMMMAGLSFDPRRM